MDKPHAAWKLFNNRYLCDLKVMDFYSLDYLKEVGIGTSGDAQLDDEAKRGGIHAYLTPIEIITKHYDGVVVTILTGAPEIYELIKQHLNDWLTSLMYYNFPYQPPMDDLYRLENFAELLHPQYISWRLSQVHSVNTKAKPLNRFALSLAKPINQASISYNDYAPFERIVHRIADYIGS